jgi:N-acetylmuramoyl-L-alanine amidase
MPAALVELLMITNSRDASVLRDEAARDAMARGVANAILEFLGLARAGL